MKKRFTLFFLLFSLGKLFAQIDVVVIDTIPTDTMLIGDQIYHTIAVIAPKDAEIEIPVLAEKSYKTTIDKGTDSIEIPNKPPDSVEVELLEIVREDTALNPNFSTRTFGVKFTVFDSGWVDIPAFEVKIKTNNFQTSYYTRPHKLLVTHMPIDLRGGLMDIRPPYQVPFSWKEFKEHYLFWVFILMGINVLVIGLWFWYTYIRKVKVPEEIVYVGPPHEIAFQKLDALEQKELWQKGKIKQYYSEVSDIVREYIERRYGVMALEMTTAELQTDLKKKKQLIEEDLVTKLSDHFSLADLVKFAKMIPPEYEHERIGKFCRYFVEETREKEEIQENVEPEKPSDI